MVKEHQYSNALELLKPTPLLYLRPLVVLLAWPCCSSSREKKALLAALLTVNVCTFRRDSFFVLPSSFLLAFPQMGNFACVAVFVSFAPLFDRCGLKHLHKSACADSNDSVPHLANAEGSSLFLKGFCKGYP